MKRSAPSRVALLFTVFAAVLALVGLASEPAFARPPKVTICHKPPGNPGNARTIRVGVFAWPAHRRHGDDLGECPEPEDDTDDDRSGNEGSPEDQPEEPADRDEPGGGDGGPDTDDDGGAVTGGAGADRFTIILCNDQAGETGRRIDVSTTGRTRVEQAECQ